MIALVANERSRTCDPADCARRMRAFGAEVEPFAIHEAGKAATSGAERLVVQPLVAATVLATGVRVLVAARRLDVAARVQSSLAPLHELLGRAMSAEDHDAYRAAVQTLDAVPRVDAGGAVPLAQPEAFAEQLTLFLNAWNEQLKAKVEG